MRVIDLQQEQRLLEPLMMNVKGFLLFTAQTRYYIYYGILFFSSLLNGSVKKKKKHSRFKLIKLSPSALISE